MQQIQTNVLKSTIGEVTIDGCSAVVDANSTVTGKALLAAVDYENENCGPFKSVSAGDEVESSHVVAKKAGLKITEPQKGNLIIDETPESWANKVNACCTPATTTP